VSRSKRSNSSRTTKRAGFPSYKLTGYLAKICESPDPAFHCIATQTKFKYYKLVGEVPLVDQKHAVPSPVFRDRQGRVVSVDSLLSSTTLVTGLKKALLRIDLSHQCHLVRDAKGDERCAPHFIGIGAIKAGTTALFHHLGQHPQVALSKAGKELEWKHRWSIPKLKPESGKIAGWINPKFNYENMTNLPKLIHDWNPDIKLIFILRDPIERAISNYIYTGNQTSRVAETQTVQFPMDSWFEAEWTFLHQCWLQHADLHTCRNDYYTTEGWPYSHFKIHRRHFIAQGLYYHILRYWLQEFPSENVLIVHYEFMKSNPVEALDSIFNFLGIAPIASALNITQRNTRPKDVASRVQMIDETFRKEMAKRYRPHNRMLYELLDTPYWDWQ
jgi:hypothetical protein